MAYQIHLDHHHFLSFLLALAVLQGIGALEFDVYNNAASTPGGARFDKEIGIPYAKQVMGDATKFIWNMFGQNHQADRRPDMEVVHLLINQYTGPAALAYVGACIVNLSAVYLQEYNYPGYDLKWSFTSVMYHEMTHIWQWYAPGTPSGLIEGIADYTSIKANYYPPELAKPGSGERWDQGYGPTARFLEYCDRLRPQFVSALNRKMRYEWSVDYFVDLLGKPVDQLWSEYKAEYEGSVSNVAVNANLSLWREYKDEYYEIKTRTETGIGCQLN